MGHKGPVLRPTCIENERVKSQLLTICSMSKWLLEQFLLNLLMCFLPYNLHVHGRPHTHIQTKAHPITHIPGNCRIAINVLTFLSDYPLNCLPNNTNELYAHSALCMSRCVIRRHFSLTALFHTSQVVGQSTLCMC